MHPLIRQPFSEQRLHFIRVENGIFFTFSHEHVHDMQLKSQMATERENLELAAKMTEPIQLRDAINELT